MNDRWEPSTAAHSIQAAAAAVNFFEPLNEVLWKRSLRMAEQICPAAGLTNRVAMNAIQMTIGPGGMISLGAPGTPSPLDETPMAGINFQRMGVAIPSVGPVATNVAEEFLVQRTGITYRTMSYTRWNAFRSKLRDLLVPTIELALQGAAVANVRLEYRDLFYFPGPPENAVVSDLLQKGSRYVAPHVFERTDLWHSHTGMFVPEAHAQKRLIQINVDANDEVAGFNLAARRTIGVMTAVQDNFTSSTWSQDLENPAKVAILISERFEDLHDHSKALFTEIITPTIAERISLHKP